MDTMECIEVLKNLSNYINEEWNHSEPEVVREIELNTKALEFAITALTNSKVVGSIQLNNKQYLINEIN